MDDIETVSPVDVEAELDRLAERYRAAGGMGIKVLAVMGGQAEDLLGRLPKPVRAGLDGATERALRLSLRIADESRARMPDQPGWINTAVTTAMGAAGGFGGLPSALVELPVTTTVLLRAVQGVAVEHGFDPKEEGVKFDCIQVFGAAGPLASDDGSDLAFLSLRLTLTGAGLQKLIATVAPRLATALGQKLASQTVPVLGAIAGATTNYLYTNYYQEIAHVHFGLRRLAINAGLSEAEMLAALNRRMGGSLT